MIAALEARIPSDLTAYKNVILASKQACQAPAVKKSYDQFKVSLNNLVHVYTKEVSAHVNEQERALVADLAMQAQQVMVNAFEGTKKVRDFHKSEWEKREKALKDGTLNQSQLESEMAQVNGLVDEKTIEFVMKLKEQTDQLHLKLLPFRIAFEQHVSGEEADSFVSSVVQGLIGMINSLVQDVNSKK